MGGSLIGSGRARIVGLAGSPIVGLPIHDRRLTSAAARRLQGYTPKRQLTYALIRASIRARADRLLPERSLARMLFSDSEHLLALHDVVASATRQTALQPVPVWPWPMHRQGDRVYIHWLSATGKPAAFTKLALRERQNSRLAREAEVLAGLAARTFERIQVPRLVAAGSLRGLEHVTTTAVPDGASPRRPGRQELGRIIADVSGSSARSVRRDQLHRLPWWRAIGESPGGLEIQSFLVSRIAQEGLCVGFAHGDFEMKNLLRCGSDQWLLDWEAASPDAPILTDPVRFWLGARHQIEQEPERALQVLLGAATQEVWSPTPTEDVAAALAYLSTTVCRSADRLIRVWAAP
jgi:hypothetical protein